VLLAARLAERDFSLGEIAETIEKAKEKLDLYFTANDLSYMEQGGRIGKAQNNKDRQYKLL